MQERVASTMAALGEAARDAARVLARTGPETKNAALLAGAEALRAGAGRC